MVGSLAIETPSGLRGDRRSMARTSSPSCSVGAQRLELARCLVKVPQRQTNLREEQVVCKAKADQGALEPPNACAGLPRWQSKTTPPPVGSWSNCFCWKTFNKNFFTKKHVFRLNTSLPHPFAGAVSGCAGHRGAHHLRPRDRRRAAGALWVSRQNLPR